MAVTKIHPIKTTLNKAVDYICNPDKTDNQILISSYGCSYQTADIEFGFTLSKARDKGDNLGHHLIQSFAPGEVSYEEAHRIGKELADKVLGGRYEYVLTTHIDKGHIHNHIIFCAVDFTTHRKYVSNKKSYYQIRNAACDRFMDKMSSLTGVFHNETMSFDRETGKPKHFQAGRLYFKGAPSEDTRLDLWFPDNRRTEECVSAYASLYPLITYYLNRLNDWGLCFRRCKVCGKYFLAKSQRYELCSDKCRKAQALQNKREFDERARENNYDLLYKNECQNWRNKINRVKNTAGFPADRLEKIQAAFADFKKEALQRKKDVKTGTASPKEFTDWLYQQSNVIIELCEIWL